MERKKIYLLLLLLFLISCKNFAQKEYEGVELKSKTNDIEVINITTFRDHYILIIPSKITIYNKSNKTKRISSVELDINEKRGVDHLYTYTKKSERYYKSEVIPPRDSINLNVLMKIPIDSIKGNELLKTYNQKSLKLGDTIQLGTNKNITEYLKVNNYKLEFSVAFVREDMVGLYYIVYNDWFNNRTYHYYK